MTDDLRIARHPAHAGAADQQPAQAAFHLAVVLRGSPARRWMLDAVRLLAAQATLRISVVLDGTPRTVAAPPAHGLSALDPVDPAEWRPWTGRDPRLAGLPDASLLLGAQPDAPDTVSSPLWVLCDSQGRALSDTPLLDAISRGQGLALQLLGSSPETGAWQLLRALHRGSPADLRAGLHTLAPAIVWLVQQAVVDVHLGVRRPADRPAPTAPADPGPLSRHVWRGRLNAWRHRHRSLWLSEFWSIGVVDAPVADWAQAHGQLPVRWLTRGRQAGYWADPMGLPGDEHRLFCEYVDEHTGIGHIELLTVDPERPRAPPRRERLTLGDGRHVSFPLVLALNGQRVGLIESCAQRQCVLYRVDAPAQWTPWHTLLPDVAAADPALFEWGGRYWLACTDIDIGAQDSLCLYHADQLEGPWQPHANNPVRLDIRGARMAGGFFTLEGPDGPMLVRPAQDCLGGYGSGIALHRVVQCTPTEYREEPLARVAGLEQAPGRDGMHTVSAWGDRTLIDAKRMGLNTRVLWRKLRSRFGRLRPIAPASEVERLCLYIPHLRLGGGETSLLRLAEGFLRQGLPVDLVVHTLQGAELAVPPGVQVIELGVEGTLAALRRLIGVLRERRPTWLLSGFPHTNVAAVVAVRCAGVQCRTVVSEHAPISRQIAQHNNLRFRCLPLLVRWAYQRADAVVAVSQGVLEDLKGLIKGELRAHVIGNPVFDDVELSAARGADLGGTPLHPWLRDDSLQVVLSVSRLSIEKDLPTLLRAFARLHQVRPATRLLIVGTGPAQPELFRLVKAAGLEAVVDMPGRIQRPMRWMREAAVFALSSTYEGFGNVLVEALASGTPVVSTDCPTGPREILSDGRYGALVPVGDAQAMAEALGRALDDRAPPAGAVAHARQFTTEKASALYLDVFAAIKVSMPC